MIQEADETRGLTIREIVLEMRRDLKEHINKGHPEYPTRRELWSILVGLSGLLFALTRI